MREIKFRGIPLYNDATHWVYGLVHVMHNSEGYGFSGRAIQTQFDNCRPNSIPVKKATVGQFTGIYDDNGIEVYEGDIVERSDGARHLVVWEKFMFNLKDFSEAFHDYPTIAFSEGISFKVIGSVHQNPELLEERP